MTALMLLSGLRQVRVMNEELVNLGAVRLDSSVVFTSDSGNLDGATLVLSGLASDDILSLQNQGAGAGEIGFDGSTVTYGGVAIGTAIGGTGGQDFVVTFNAAASADSIDAVVENLTYENLSDEPTEFRQIGLSLTHADGTEAIAPILFTEQIGSQNPLDGFSTGKNSTVSLVDLDRDGDLDVVAGRFNGRFDYYMNTGTATAPSFVLQLGTSNPFAGQDVGTLSNPEFSDLDADGDLDMLSGAADGSIRYFLNSGTAIAPAFVEQIGAANPFNSISAGGPTVPRIADLDGDGDGDLVLADGTGGLAYFENTAGAGATNYVQMTGGSNPFSGISIAKGSGFKLSDLDNDGDLDLALGLENGKIAYFQNTGDALNAVFEKRTGEFNPFDGFDAGTLSAPDIADLDADGDVDVLIGDGSGQFHYLENDETARKSNPGTFTLRTGPDNPFDGVDVLFDSVLSFADLDADGDFDAAIGSEDGTLLYFENTGTRLAPVMVERTGAANPFNSVAVGLDSTPAFADLDADGDDDLIVGAENGTLSYYENTGTPTNAQFTLRKGAKDPLSGVIVAVDSAPRLADLDGDGDADLFVGSEDGTLKYFENIGDGTSPAFEERTGSDNPFDAINIGPDSLPTFADLDNDGDIDALLGEDLGEISYVENTGTATSPVLVLHSTTGNPFKGVDVGNGASPSIVDLNGDGKLDVVVGEFNGTVNFFENTSANFSIAVTIKPHADPSQGDDVMNGTAGDDIIASLGGNDTVRGLAGDDILDAGLGNDVIDGGDGVDTARFLLNTATVDLRILGPQATGEGSDTLLFIENLRTGSGDDLLVGNALDNLIVSFNGNDEVHGGGGNDTLRGGNGEDDLSGNSGNDVLVSGGGADLLKGGTGDDLLKGGGNVDRLFGGTGNDKFFGNGGNDNLFGGDGNDTIIAGAGDDQLRGDAGNDKLKGGNGIDTFKFTVSGDKDKIVDFQDNIDKLDISDFGFANASQALALASDVNGHVVFSFGSGDTLIVRNFVKANLDAGDFTL